MKLTALGWTLVLGAAVGAYAVSFVVGLCQWVRPSRPLDSGLDSQ